MVTPFVPSPGSYRVSRSDPGAWLILRAIAPTPPPPPPPPPLLLHHQLEAVGPPRGLARTRSRGRPGLQVRAGAGHRTRRRRAHRRVLPQRPQRWPLLRRSQRQRGRGGRSVAVRRRLRDGIHRRGGGGKASKPSVQVGVQHVSCMADVAVFIALSAAIDLSMDACQLFSQKLRKSLTLLQLLEFILIRYHSLTFFKLGFPGDLARRRLRLAHIQMSGDGVHQQVELLLE
ncbi:hypothetical protein OPV22_016447 [Ensete ventricosum]|uniref:Uncharacterized protein n=1 Tax=Ensete ventricosum TaxID=4639 RepID=A0AAV8QPX4_ENSVE|nr:hypothetical protein OPV22_016447 [Ensete ventricosum]